MADCLPENIEKRGGDSMTAYEIIDLSLEFILLVVNVVPRIFKRK